MCPRIEGWTQASLAYRQRSRWVRRTLRLRHLDRRRAFARHLTQPCRMFALLPCDVATFATDAFAATHSAKICAFHSALYRQRLSLASIVSSYLLRGHDRGCSRFGLQDGFAGCLPTGYGRFAFAYIRATFNAPD